MTSQHLVTLTLSAATCLAGCAAPRASEPPVVRAVRVAEARVPEAPRGLRYAVTIQPSDQLTLAVKASGYVDDLHQVRADDGRQRTVQPGDVIRAGTVLVRLRTAEYRERLHQAEGGLQEVEATRGERAWISIGHSDCLPPRA